MQQKSSHREVSNTLKEAKQDSPREQVFVHLVDSKQTIVVDKTIVRTLSDLSMYLSRSQRIRFPSGTAIYLTSNGRPLQASQVIGDIEVGATVELRSRGLVGGMMNKVNDLVKNYDNNYKRVKDADGTVPL